MSEQIHGHAVMEMMLKKDQSFTRETLYEAIVEEFGAAQEKQSPIHVPFGAVFPTIRII